MPQSGIRYWSRYFLRLYDTRILYSTLVWYCDHYNTRLVLLPTTYNVLSKYVRPLHYYCVHRMKYIFYYIHYNNTIIVLIIIEKRKWEINSRLYCQSLEFVENFLDDLYLRSSHLYYTYIYIYIEVCLQNYVIIMNYSWISSII